MRVVTAKQHLLLLLRPRLLLYAGIELVMPPNSTQPSYLSRHCLPERPVIPNCSSMTRAMSFHFFTFLILIISSSAASS